MKRIKAQAEVLVSEAVMTSQIEGEKYDLLSVRSSVHQKLGLSHAGLPRTERHIDGLVEVLLDATSNFTTPLTLQKIKSWQAALFLPAKKIINKFLDMGEGNFKGGMTTRKYVGMVKVSRATAYRELNDLLKKEILRLNNGGGRSVSYDLVWEI